MPLEGDSVVRVGGRTWDRGLTGVVRKVMGEICVVEYDEIPGQVWFRHQDDLIVLEKGGVALRWGIHPSDPV